MSARQAGGQFDLSQGIRPTDDVYSYTGTEEVLTQSKEMKMATYDQSDDARRPREKLIPCDIPGCSTMDCPYAYSCHSTICRVHAFVRWIGEYALISDRRAHSVRRSLPEM